MKNIYAVYKPKGPSSFAIINQIKKATGEQRVGHAGTLDPLAEGVLVIGVGREATKQLAEIVKKEKEYIAEIKLGVTSSTGDAEGIDHKNTKAQKHKNKRRDRGHLSASGGCPVFTTPTQKEVESVVKKFVGVIDQTPPIYSAIKVRGQRAYKIARTGQAVAMSSRKVEIKKIKILKYKFPDLKIKVTTGKGVYIRSLAQDIGEKLGIGGYMSGLIRTGVGQFKIKQAVTVEKIVQDLAQQRIKILKNGGIAVIPTDTIYGLVGLALKPKTVERIYKVRKRRPDKPLIILISSIDELKKFGVKLNGKDKKILQKYWPGKISVILPCNKKLAYLHRGTNTLAFRLPDDLELIKILKQTGPLVAPSANLEGKDPALTIKQAKRYFSGLVDFYWDKGKLESEPSTLVRIENGELEVLRQGAVKV